ncbi:DUF1488 family protein [Shinella sp.]|uniref:DUF1488 family protein n=1 Tax=Shinella sp. TaxID=1870904 RepID=UPI003F723133
MKPENHDETHNFFGFSSFFRFQSAGRLILRFEGTGRLCISRSLSFPNQSRSYEEAGKRIRFIGQDGMFEIPFFAGAFSGCNLRSWIPECFRRRPGCHLKAARRPYSNARRLTYVLARADFG